MKAPALPLLALLLTGACQPIPDPCAGYGLACLAVTANSGPPQTYQLEVVVDGFGSVTPLTPETLPSAPLVYPLRFAIRFAQFQHGYNGMVTVLLSALAQEGAVLGQVRKTVAIDNMDKVPLEVDIGAPYDMLLPADLSRPADLRGPDLLSTPVDQAGPMDGASD